MGALALVAVICAVGWWLAGDHGEQPVREPGDESSKAPDEGGPQLETRGEAPPKVVEPAPVRGSGRVFGVVLDAADAPVVGVAVVASRSQRFGANDPFDRILPPSTNKRVVARGVTDARGRFALDGIETGSGSFVAPNQPHYEVEAVVEAPRRSTRALLANWGRLRSHAIVLRVLEGVALACRVVDAADRPVAAIVRAYAAGDDVRPMSQTAWGFGPLATDEGGRFSIPSAPTGLLRFDVHVAGRLALRGLEVEVPETGEVVIRLGGANAGRVTGRLADGDGVAIDGATVLLDVRTETAGRANYVFQATTDTSGAFEVTGVPPGALVRLSARGAGWLPRSWRSLGRSVRAGEATHLELTLYRGSVLRGRVLDNEGAVVVGARVGAYGGSAHNRLHALTDADGSYTLLGLTPGDYELYVRARGYYDPEGPTIRAGGGSFSSGWHRVGGPNEHYQLRVEAAGSESERDFTIQRGMPLRGVVLAPDGSPAVGAQVRWRHQKPRRGGRSWQPEPVTIPSPGDLEPVAVTDAEGRFEHPGLGPAEAHWVILAHTEASCSEAVVVSDFDKPVALTLRLKGPGTLRGRVVDARGQPLPRLTVRLDAEGAGTVAIGMTDEHGAFEFDALAPATYQVNAMARVDRRWRTVGSSAKVPLEPPNEPAAIVINAVIPASGDSPWPRRTPAAKRLAITGTVLAPDGTRVDSGIVRVKVEGGRGASGAILRGAFEAQVGGSSLSFEVNDARDREGRRIMHAPFSLTGKSADKGPFTLQLGAGGVIAGRVVDDDGKGIPDVRVWIDTRRGRRGQVEGHRTNSDASGAFRLEGLTPGGHRLKLVLSAEYLGPREVSATTDDTDLTLSYTRGAVIAGQLLGPDGKGIENVEMSAMPGDRSTAKWVNARSGKDGRFRFAGLTQGAIYTVRARPWERDIGRSDLMLARERDVRPGREDLVLHLKVGGFIEGTLLRPDGSPAAAHMLSAFAKGETAGGVQATADGQGAFRVGPFPTGANVTVTAFPKAKTEDPLTRDGVLVPTLGLTLRLQTSRTRKGSVAAEGLVGFQWAWTTAGQPHGMRGPVESDGSFLLNRLPAAGTVTLYLYGRKDDRYVLVENVKTSGDPLELTFVEGRSIKGSIDPALRKRSTRLITIRAESVSHGFFKQTYPKQDGAFHLRGLPPGRYLLHVMDMQGKELTAVEAEAGAEGIVLR